MKLHRFLLDAARGVACSVAIG